MDKLILEVAKQYDVPICLMHNRSKPKNIENQSHYKVNI